MEEFAYFFLQVFDLLTFGLFSRADRPTDAAKVEDRLAERNAMVGRTGIAFSPLRPSGKVEIDGRHHDAASDGGFIDAGTTVEVVGWSGFVMIVRGVNDSQ
jgi:membrane-bound ClpP family serine protease